MQKVFRLLRNNIETGPFTIGELLQQQLQPSDLIWVDGESMAWAYPGEMPTLKYALEPEEIVKNRAVARGGGKSRLRKEEGKKAPAPKISQKSDDEIERKAEELRRRSLAFKRTPDYHLPPTWASETTPVIPLNDNEVEVIYHKRRGLPVGEVLMGAMIAGLLTLGWFGGGKTLFQPPKEVISAVATQLVQTEENKRPAPERRASTDTVVVARLQDSAWTPAQPVAKAPVKKIKVPSLDTALDGESLALAGASTLSAAAKKEEEKAKQALLPDEIKEDSKTETATVEAREESPAEVSEKKKGLGQVLKGLFKKKKKEEDKPTEEVEPIGK